MSVYRHFESICSRNRALFNRLDCELDAADIDALASSIPAGIDNTAPWPFNRDPFADRPLFRCPRGAFAND